jgi:hypothetical protein
MSNKREPVSPLSGDRPTPTPPQPSEEAASRAVLDNQQALETREGAQEETGEEAPETSQEASSDGEPQESSDQTPGTEDADAGEDANDDARKDGSAAVTEHETGLSTLSESPSNKRYEPIVHLMRHAHVFQPPLPSDRCNSLTTIH